jgi:energy-coupling factor transporter ATP-binding protein EcfA2
MLEISTTVNRQGYLIIIGGLNCSVTFYPNDKDKTFNTLINKLKELGSDVSDHERMNIDVQLTNIYKEYYQQRAENKISDAQHLVNLAAAEIKDQFTDETGAFYVIIDRDGHKELLNMDYQKFDLFMSSIFYNSGNKILSKDTLNNAKRLLKSFSKQKRFLFNRVARIDDTLYYDLNDDQWQCVKITKEGWEVTENPGIFRRISADRSQVIPFGTTDNTSRSVKKEIFDKSTIKNDYQKLIAEVYVISLFISDIAHPMIIPIGPKGSGKSLLLRLIALIVDPRDKDEALVQRLPRDQKDRRVNIFNNYISYFDNETTLNTDEMDELCTWVTGYSGTVRVLHTTDESRTYSGKRPIGINGINIPVVNSDILSRSFVLEMQKVDDGSDGLTESQLIPENEIIHRIRNIMPETLGHIFDTLVKALRKYDEVRKEIKPNHRLADFVIWGETISRVLGNKNNEFLEAWKSNVKNQNLILINNNTLAQLVIGYVFNHRVEIDFEIEPQELLRDLRIYAVNHQIDYDKYLPQNPSWLSRNINSICNDLVEAGLIIDPDIRREHKRFIGFKKINKNLPTERTQNSGLKAYYN